MADEFSMGETFATRREWDTLRDELRRELGETRAWIERIDTHGTRNAGVTEAKVVDNAADIADLKAEFRAHLADHKRVTDTMITAASEEREQAKRERASHKRFVVSTAAGALGVAAGWLGLLYEVIHHAH